MAMAVASTGTNYMIQHPPPSLDSGDFGEWTAKFGAETMIAWLSSAIQASAYTAKNRSWYFKSLLYEMATFEAIGADAGVYQLLSKWFWDTDDQYETEFARIIYQSQDMNGTLDKYFKDKPDVKKQLGDRYKTILDTLMDLGRKGDLGLISADEMVAESKKLLKESEFSNDKDPASQLRQDPFYAELLDKNLIDPDLLKQTNDVDDDIINVMTEVVWQNAKYENQGGFDPERKISGIYGFLPFSNETDDRFKYNIEWERYHFPASLVKNYLVYRTICYDRYLPYPANIITAIGAYALYRIPNDYFKQHYRRIENGY